MPSAPAKPPLKLQLLTGLLLAASSWCAAQTSAPVATPVSSSSLPEAPQPQNAEAQQATTLPPDEKKVEPVTLIGTPKRFLDDQKVIWTSPRYIRLKDAKWLIPFGTATGLLISSDQHTMTQSIHITPDGQNKADKLSTGSVAAIAAIPAAGYLWSLVNYAPQAHETGLLAGEAVADSLVVNEALKVTFRRDRPLINNASGNFFSSSINDSSFPSNHAIAAWSMASVIGSEYPGWLSRTIVYGLAGTVSVSRVLAEQHFPSDVLVGSVTGWLIGHYVYKAHHDPSVNPYESQPLPASFIPHYTSPAPALATSSQAASTAASPLNQSVTSLPPVPSPTLVDTSDKLPDDYDPDTIGSTNVPMDSWVYPALERLGSLGLIPTQSMSIRPWTRQECLRQLRQAEDLIDRQNGLSSGLINEANRLIDDLQHEFEDEPATYQALTLESAYTRYGTIAGPALADSYHFGQTWWNDFGRPLGRGGSAIAGFSVRAHQGRLFFYSRQELQHSPGNPAESPAINQLINQLDRIQPDSDPVIQPIAQRSAYDRQRPIEMYAGVAMAGNALSFGKQELYWGPTTMGPLAFSSNAEPTYNLRFVSTRPHPLPLIPSLGTYRFDVVIGKLSGHSYPARPWFNGQKIDFNFGDNLELSFTRWSVFWGVGHPITLHSFKDNVFSFNSTGGGASGGGGSSGYGDPTDPGDRKSNFDFRYKLPFLQKVVTLYADAYSDDDPSPIDAPRRAVWNPGIYFARLPYLPHMDLRVEAVSSEGLFTDFGGQHFFINNQYLDSNTNKSFLLGNAIGRDARAIEGRTGYWFSGRTRIEAGYRQNKGGTAFLPGGATITDGFVNSSIALNRHWTVQTFTQYERFLIPSYMKGSQHNVSGWLQITWNPELSLHR